MVEGWRCDLDRGCECGADESAAAAQQGGNAAAQARLQARNRVAVSQGQQGVKGVGRSEPRRRAHSLRTGQTSWFRMEQKWPENESRSSRISWICVLSPRSWQLPRWGGQGGGGL